jgi:hypothetical protein
MWLLGIPFLFVIFGSILFQRTGMSSLFDTAVFAYLSGAVLAAHPFIALGITESLLSQGENPFFFVLDLPGGNEVLAPSPWLAFTVIALLGTAAFLWLSVRRISAMRQRRPRPLRRPTPPAPPQPAAVPTQQDG